MARFKKHGVYETPFITADICSHDLYDGKMTCDLCACGKWCSAGKKSKVLRDTCVAFECVAYDHGLSFINDHRQTFLTNLKFKQK